MATKPIGISKEKLEQFQLAGARARDNAAIEHRARLSGHDPESARKMSAFAAEISKQAVGEPQGMLARASDSFTNFFAKIGIGAGNIASGGGYTRNPISWDRPNLDYAYEESWIVAAAIDYIAEDMTKRGITLIGDNKPSDYQKVLREMRNRQFWPKIRDAIKWARLYGTAGVVPIIDGQRLDTPLRIDTVGNGQFRNLVVLDRWQLIPSTEDLVRDQNDPHVNMPRFYTVTAEGIALSGQRIHHTRFLRFDGVKVPYYPGLQESLWSISVVQRIYDRILPFDSGTNGIGQMLYKAYQKVYKFKDLRKGIAAGGPAMAVVLQSLELMNFFASQQEMPVIDGEDDVEHYSYTFGGIAEIMTSLGDQLCGALRMPRIKLFGSAGGAGLDSGGNDEMQGYENDNLTRQESDLRPNLDTIVNLTARSVGVKFDEGTDFEFNPLSQLSDEKKAEVAERVGRLMADLEERGTIPLYVARKELKAISKSTGIFTNLTDEDVEDAKNQPAPDAGAVMGEETDGPVPGKPKQIEEMPEGGARDAIQIGVVEILSETDLRNAISNAVIDRTKEVQSIAVAARKGATTYIDRRVPDFLDMVNVAGQWLDPVPVLNLRAQVERHCILGMGLKPQSAVGIAEVCERAWLAENGYEYAEWQAWQADFQNTIAREPVLLPAPETIARDSAGDVADPVAWYQDIPLCIENRRGSIRKGDGWQAKMAADYGYIRLTGSAEGMFEPLDVFVGPSKKSNTVWVVNQNIKDTTEFDEHKCMLGFESEAVAVKAYLDSYSDDATGRMGEVVEMPMAEFKNWVAGNSFDYPLQGEPGAVDDPQMASDGWNEADHPRGQPENAGQFGSGGGSKSEPAAKSGSGKSEKSASKASAATKSITEKVDAALEAGKTTPAKLRDSHWLLQEYGEGGLTPAEEFEVRKELTSYIEAKRNPSESVHSPSEPTTKADPTPAQKAIAEFVGPRAITEPYNAGTVASGLSSAEAQKKEWRKGAPSDFDDLVAKSPANQAALAEVCKDIASELGLYFKDPGVKKTARIKDKIDRGKSVQQVNDAVRAGFNADSPAQADRVVDILSKHFEVADEEFQRVDTGYFDRKTMVRFKDGQIGEIQMWPPGMLEAKENGGGHEMYTEWQELQNTDPTNPRGRELEDGMKKLYAGVYEKLSPDWKKLFG